MRYQQNWERPVRIEDKNMISDYRNSMHEFEGTFDGKPFKAKVIYAYTKLVEFKTKKGKARQCEVLHLVLTPDNTMYFQYDMWGNSRTYNDVSNSWSEWSDNSAEMQDFLYICGTQKGKEFLQHYHTSTDYEEREVYPHLCGVEVYVVAAKTGEREKDGKFYDKNTVVLFNSDGRSAVEMQNKSDAFEIKKVSADLINAHNEFVGADIPQTFGGVEVQSVQTINPDNEPSADDLPF